MPMSRSMKNTMRGAKAPKGTAKEAGAGTNASKQYTQTGNKKNPSPKADKSSIDDSGSMKLVI